MSSHRDHVHRTNENWRHWMGDLVQHTLGYWNTLVVQKYVFSCGLNVLILIIGRLLAAAGCGHFGLIYGWRMEPIDYHLPRLHTSNSHYFLLCLIIILFPGIIAIYGELRGGAAATARAKVVAVWRDDGSKDMVLPELPLASCSHSNNNILLYHPMKIKSTSRRRKSEYLVGLPRIRTTSLAMKRRMRLSWLDTDCVGVENRLKKCPVLLRKRGLVCFPPLFSIHFIYFWNFLSVLRITTGSKNTVLLWRYEIYCLQNRKSLGWGPSTADARFTTRNFTILNR